MKILKLILIIYFLIFLLNCNNLKKIEKNTITTSIDTLLRKKIEKRNDICNVNKLIDDINLNLKTEFIYKIKNETNEVLVNIKSLSIERLLNLHNNIMSKKNNKKPIFGWNKGIAEKYEDFLKWLDFFSKNGTVDIDKKALLEKNLFKEKEIEKKFNYDIDILSFDKIETEIFDIDNSLRNLYSNFYPKLDGLYVELKDNNNILVNTIYSFIKKKYFT